MGWQVKVALEWRGSQDEEDGIATYSLPGKKFNLWMPSFEHARRVEAVLEDVFVEGRRVGMRELTDGLYKTIDEIAKKS